MSSFDSVIDVQTGEVKSGRRGCVLVSRAIGSCVAVGVYDLKYGCAGLSHVMLPGVAERNLNRFRYAHDALNELMRQMDTMGSCSSDRIVCLAGGANVLKHPDDSICRLVTASVRNVVAEKGLVVVAESLGGTERRMVRLDSRLGFFYCAVGDSTEKLLWAADSSPTISASSALI